MGVHDIGLPGESQGMRESTDSEGKQRTRSGRSGGPRRNERPDDAHAPHHFFARRPRETRGEDDWLGPLRLDACCDLQRCGLGAATKRVKAMNDGEDFQGSFQTFTSGTFG